MHLKTTILRECLLLLLFLVFGALHLFLNKHVDYIDSTMNQSIFIWIMCMLQCWIQFFILRCTGTYWKCGMKNECYSCVIKLFWGPNLMHCIFVYDLSTSNLVQVTPCPADVKPSTAQWWSQVSANCTYHAVKILDKQGGGDQPRTNKWSTNLWKVCVYIQQAHFAPILGRGFQQNWNRSCTKQQKAKIMPSMMCMTVNL